MAGDVRVEGTVEVAVGILAATNHRRIRPGQLDSHPRRAAVRWRPGGCPRPGLPVRSRWRLTRTRPRVPRQSLCYGLKERRARAPPAGATSRASRYHLV